MVTSGGSLGRSSVDGGHDPSLSAVVEQHQPVARSTLGGPHSAVDHYHRRISVGWGAHIQDLIVQGMWSPHHMGFHMNHLKLLAILLPLKAVLRVIHSKVALVRTDNMTAI